MESDFHDCGKALWAKPLLGVALKRDSSLHTSMAPSPTALGPAPPSGAWFLCGTSWRAVKRLPGGPALRGLSPELPKLPYVTLKCSSLRATDRGVPEDVRSA